MVQHGPDEEADRAALAEELHRTRAELETTRRAAAVAIAKGAADDEAGSALSDFVTAAPGALWVADAPSGRGLYVSPGAAELLGAPPEALLPEAGRWLGLVHPDDRAAVERHFAALQAGEVSELAYRILPPGNGDGGAASRPAAHWVTDLGFPIHDAGGQTRRVAGFTRSSEGSPGEEGLRRLLLAELNHRVRNAFAALQAVAAQTSRFAPEPGRFWEAFAGRLRAMAQAHDMLAGRGWTEGAELRALLELELAPYLHVAGTAGPRAELDGPPVRLGPSVALALALALHELATNAARHGALSAVSGCVRITWRLTTPRQDATTAFGRLRLEWQELGGPPTHPPERRGFGSRLLTGALSAQLGGRVCLRFAETGLRAIIEASLPPPYAPPDAKAPLAIRRKSDQP